MGGFIMVAGLYASITSIVDGALYVVITDRRMYLERCAGYKSGLFATPFSCANQGLS